MTNGPALGAAKRPWYREPLVWMIIAIPASAVVMGVVITVCAVTSFSGLVVDDYYRRGLEIGRTLERDTEAEHLRLRGTVELDPRRRTVVATVQGNAGFAPPAHLTVRFLHATHAGADVTLVLPRGPDGRWKGRAPALAAGGWYVQIETDAWRLSARVASPAAGRIVLRPVATGGKG